MPRTAMRTAQMAMIRTLSQRPSRTAGKDATALSQLKKVSWTRGHPGEDVTTRTAATAMTRVVSAESVVERTERRRR